MTSFPASGHFPRSYRQAREQLLAAASAHAPRLGLTIDSRAIARRGPEGETLAIDALVFGARRPRHALVLSSGTHGVEGFCGSAIQHQFVSRQLPAIALERDTALILVHAINPYGFAWLRRVNEDNVDLNRNFHDDFDALGAHDDYVTLHDALNPTDLDPDNEALRFAALWRFADEYGMDRLQRAISQGQYRYPDGLQFGGTAPAASVTHLRALVDEYLADADTVYWLDFHTGLGESGDCQVITTAAPDSAACATTREVWPEAVSASAPESLSPPLAGPLDLGIATRLKPGSRHAIAFPEFGTHPLERVMRAFRADNWLHAFGPGDVLFDPVAREIKIEILEAFRPDDERWRTRVLETGARLAERALQVLPGVHG